MIKIFGIEAVVISNFYDFASKNMVSKPTLVELEQGGPLGGLAHWAVNPSMVISILEKRAHLKVLYHYMRQGSI